MFRHCQRRRFSGRADRYDAVHASLDLELDEILQAPVVNLSLPGLEGIGAEAVFTLLEQVIRASQPS